MKKLILFVIFCSLTLLGIYKANTSHLAKSEKLYKKEQTQRDLIHEQLRVVDEKNKQRLEFYIKDGKGADAQSSIEEYKSTKTLALKSRIITHLVRYKLVDQGVREFLKTLIMGDDNFITASVINNLSLSRGKEAFEILKEVLYSEKQLDDATYASMMITLAYTSPDEEKELYINKLMAMVNALEPVAQREVLKALLELTNGSEEVITMINLRLQRRKDLNFEMFALRYLTQYDTTWIDKKRNEFIQHKSPMVKILFIDKLKYYCPKDLWDVYGQMLKEADNSVMEKLFSELVSFGPRSVSFLEKNKDQFKDINKRRMDTMFRTLKQKNNDPKFCPNLK